MTKKTVKFSSDSYKIAKCAPIEDGNFVPSRKSASYQEYKGAGLPSIKFLCENCLRNKCPDCGLHLSKNAEVGSIWMDLSRFPATKWEKKENGWEIVGHIND